MSATTASIRSSRKQAPVAPASVLAARGRLLQRKCTCGGAPGPTGECEECRKNRLSLQRKTRNSEPGTQNGSPVTPIVHEVLRSPGQPLDGATRSFIDARSGHDFSRMRVQADDNAAASAHAVKAQAYTVGNDVVFAARPYSPTTSSTSQPQSSCELGSEDPAMALYSADGVMMSRDSGTCQNGGGSSVCNINTGNYDIVANGNTCCTKDCTQQHEQTHVVDFNASGCCKAASAAYTAKGADKNAVIKKYNDWLALADPVSECHAYNTGVACAAALAKTKDCDGAGKATDCCKDIVGYQSHYSALAKSACAAAPAKMPPCPAFSPPQPQPPLPSQQGPPPPEFNDLPGSALPPGTAMA